MKGKKKFKRKKPKRKIASIFQGDYLQVHLTHTHTHKYICLDSSYTWCNYNQCNTTQ